MLEAIDLPFDEETIERINAHEQIYIGDDLETLTVPDQITGETPHFSLQITPGGFVEAYPAGSTPDRLPVARFDISQLTDDALRQHANDCVDPTSRWANYLYLISDEGGIPPFVDYNLENEPFDTLSGDWRLPEFYKQSLPAHINDKHDIDGSDIQENNLIETLSRLSEGDLVKFGGGISPKRVNNPVVKDDNEITVMLEEPDSTPDSESAIDHVFIAIKDAECEYGPTQTIFSPTYGESETDTNLGVIEDATISPYTASEYDADTVATITWTVDPTPSTEE